MNWGSSTQAVTYRTILTMSYQYNAIADHVKNFRPQCLVLCDSPQEESDLLYLVSHVTKNNGLMICGQVKGENTISKQQADYEKSNAWLSQNKIKAFHTISTGILKSMSACDCCCLSLLNRLFTTIITTFLNSEMSGVTQTDEYILGLPRG